MKVSLLSPLKALIQPLYRHAVLDLGLRVKGFN